MGDTGPLPEAHRGHWRRWAAAAALVVGVSAGVPLGVAALHDARGSANGAAGGAAGGATGAGRVPVTPDGEGDIRHLTPKLRSAVTRAIEAARSEGVALRVTSGYRDKALQKRLYDEAIAKYGSPEVARQWVLPPNESAHVRGEAVDVGPTAGADWLRGHGVRFGLCQRYANESWHFERLAGAVGSTCPDLEAHA